MILTSFEGRIGNNLFQLAACLSLSTKLNTKAYAGLSGNLIKMKENFKLKDINFIEVGHANGFNFRGNIPKQIEFTYNEKTYNYDDDFFKIPNNSFIDGFFQSEKYFKKIEKKIRKNFQFKNHIVEHVNKINNFFPKQKKTGFIHIRRQDYLEGNNIYAYAKLEKEYYLNCIDEADLEIIYVFSDDIQWCIDTFNDFDDKKFIFINENNPYVCLYMMSLLNTAIIANSTFSWWGAWLNRSKYKKVYYPLNWYTSFVYEKTGLSHNEYIKDLICDGWIGR